MNLIAPVKSIMSTNLITVKPDDTLQVVKEKFDNHKIHHLPVVGPLKQIEGIISKTDFKHFMRGFSNFEVDKLIDKSRLQNRQAKEIMTPQLATVTSHTRINVILDIFLKNWFHAIPVVDHDELVGIVTTYDVIKLMSKEPIKLEDYSKQS
jgi:acetoin utilization protein AcuB